MGRRGVFSGVGRELRQRYARERWSWIEFACVSLTEKMKTYNNQSNQWSTIIHPEPSKLVVPGDPRLAGGLEGVDGWLGDGDLDPGDALSGGIGHGRSMAHGAR